MRAAAIAVLGVLIVAFPVASAPFPPPIASLVTHLSAHPSHLVLPENRQADVALELEVRASGFTCALPARIDVQVIFAAAFPEWAGASVNPDTAHFVVAPMQLVTPGKIYRTENLHLEVYWAADHPPGASWTYKLGTITRLGAGPCFPAPAIYENDAHVVVHAPA